MGGMVPPAPTPSSDDVRKLQEAVAELGAALDRLDREAARASAAAAEQAHDVRELGKRLIELADLLAGRFGQLGDCVGAVEREVKTLPFYATIIGGLVALIVAVAGLTYAAITFDRPHEPETAARDLAKRHGASVRTIEGEKLLGANYPLIHAVGRAAARAPRLIDVTWGDPACPKVTVVGKGVCFDTGGLNIKPETNMRLMKKDMGGAATALALAHMLMARASRVK